MEHLPSKICMLLLATFIFIQCDSSEPEIDMITDPDSQTEVVVFQIGEMGPGGGIVFYDKGSVSNGWQYIEVAQEEITKLQWGCYNNPIAQTYDKEIGSGKSNTESIVEFHSGLSDFYNNPGVCGVHNDGTVAAKYSLEYTSGGLSDWHLPSSDEVLEFYTVLHLNGIGDFTEDGQLYWSSTQFGDNTAVATDFSNGDQGYLPKDFGDLTITRAVRYF